MSYCRPPLVLPSLSSCLECDPGHLPDMAQAAWEEQQSPYALVVEVIQDMQEQVNRIVLITCQHMQEAQAKQSQQQSGSYSQATMFSCSTLIAGSLFTRKAHAPSNMRVQ